MQNLASVFLFVIALGLLSDVYRGVSLGGLIGHSVKLTIHLYLLIVCVVLSSLLIPHHDVVLN
jgi:uncharacterized membrane protein (Fun14 family)